jgi:glycosyltransferase involved in cell wall biosynthesis
MIPSYNRIKYLEAALGSVLAQDPGVGVMQIEVVDDASTIEDPEPLVRQMGGDRVVFFRRSRNVGQFGNLNTCIERARGKWVHILHSDDMALPGFYERFRSALRDRDDLGAAFCRHAIIDGNGRRLRTSVLERDTPGQLPDYIEKIGASPRLQFPSIVVRRAVYEKLGGFRLDLPCAGDWEMWVRIAASYPLWYDPEILAAYREHTYTVTGKVMTTGENIVDNRRCVEICHAYLPPDRADAISRRGKEWAAIYAFDNAYMALGRAEFKIAYRQLREGLKSIVTPRVIGALLWQILRIPLGAVRRIYRLGKIRWGHGSPESTPSGNVRIS